MFKRKKFHIVVDTTIWRTANENVRHLNAKECRKDGLKSKSIENGCASRRRGEAPQRADGGRQTH